MPDAVAWRPMKFIVCLFVFWAASLPTLLAGRLDFAVVRFASLVEQSDLEAALEGESLTDLIVGDRLQSRKGVLRGGLVLFAQSLQVASSQVDLSNTTRIGNQEAAVKGALRGRSIALEVSLEEGVEAPLKRFSRRVYNGSGSLLGGSPRVLGFRQIESRTPTVVKGKSKTISVVTTNILVYQYRP